MPTLELPLRTTMGGVDVGAPQLLYRYDFPVNAASGTHDFASGGWRDFPDLMYYPTLTKSSTLLLVHYQISWGFDNSADSFLACRLYVDGNEATAARSIDGSGPYGTVLGTWISWLKMASTLSDDTAPSASLDHLEAQVAPTQPRAQPEPLGSLPWPQEPATGRPKVEDSPLSTTRWIGTVSGPSSPQITVQCRNSHYIDLQSDYMTKALNVVILSES